MLLPDPSLEEKATCVLQRARGEAAVRVTARGLEQLYQEGCAKVRLPRTGAAPEAVLINTSGGLTGGDRLAWTAEAGAGARLIVSTQACEKVYRALGDAAEMAVTLRVEAGARLEWLPQETIVFDGAALERRIEADVDATGELLAVEAVILGRTAMGETVRRGRLVDRWRIRRAGRLAFADNLRLDGDIAAAAARPPVLAGMAAFASLLRVGPEAESKLDALRRALGPHGGASAFDGLLFARIAAPDGAALRGTLTPALAILRCGEPPPRVWGL